MGGYDLETIKMVSENTNIPIIAAGGAGSSQHFPEAISAGALAVSAASIFHFTSVTPNDCKESMAKSGYAVRE